MLVSWNWLAEYVKLDMTPDVLAERLMMAGLNHEETTRVGDDWAVNFEVTSNRPDWLGHIGVAREISVLWDRALAIPVAEPKATGPAVAELTSVRIENPDHCPRYTARVIRGVKVGPSPKWLVDRLATIGIPAINNVVDISNYVLFECGQPLHAFDLARLEGRQIIVRQARQGEKFLAINHKTYELDPSMCVIADARRAVAIGGVMGGADTEVSTRTTELLIESAQFAPLSIRGTARKLHLHSDSSYRFERGLNPAGVDWASRRCCELILDLAGGELAAGSLDVGAAVPPREPIVLRFNQLKRVLGIDVEPAEAVRILTALGCRQVNSDSQRVEVVPPSWRRDLTREIDLVEEVARIHGYDKIPEDVSVPMVASRRTRHDRVLRRVRQVLSSAGFDEAMTLSAVEDPVSSAFSPWTDAAPLVAATPVLKRADHLRRSLIPSLLIARQTNEALGNRDIELFETAHVYLPRAAGELPDESLMLALTSGRDFIEVKGVLETLVATLNPRATLRVVPSEQKLLEPSRSARLALAVEGKPEQHFGFLGEVSATGLDEFQLRARTTVAELRLAPLDAIAQLIPQYHRLPAFPSLQRDLNLVVDESVAWADVEATVRQAAGPALEALQFQDVYRDRERLGAGKKSLLFTLVLRSADATLTSEQADQICHGVVQACGKQHGAQLRA